MISERLKHLAATGVLAAGLGIATITGAFAAAPSATVTPTPRAASVGARSGGHRGTRGGFFFGPVATFLGISQSALQSALKSGQTLTQIAQAHGKSAADLKTLLLNQQKTRLDQAVAAGRLSSQQETNFLNQASSRIDRLLTQKFQNLGYRWRGHRGQGTSSTSTRQPTATPTATSS